jgi:8-oxo-dGTP diphosphatase
MVEFCRLDSIDDSLLKFAVIYAMYRDRWVFVRHRERSTWEMPGGHREAGESIGEAAARELFEETGARVFSLDPVCIYSVNDGTGETYGQLFYSVISAMGELPASEIGERRCFLSLPHALTYPHIQPFLHARIEEYRKAL